MAEARRDDARSIPKPIGFNIRKHHNTTRSNLLEHAGRDVGKRDRLIGFTNI